MEGQGGGYVRNCVRLVLSRAHKNRRLAAHSYVLLLYTLCAAEGLAWLLSLLYSTRLVNGQSTRVTPMSHSLEEESTHGQLQDTRPR